MGIYRGPGGTGESSSNTAINEIAALTQQVLEATETVEDAKEAAEAAQAAAASSAAAAAASAADLDAAVTAAQAAQEGAEEAQDASVAAKIAAQAAQAASEAAQAASEAAEAAAEALLDDVYTKSEADTLLAAKANQSTTYTKTEVDGFTVKLTGDQTVAGVKTFSSSPVVPNATTAAQALSFGQVSTANAAPVKTALNASGDAPIYACRAWVNFNGTGTVAIRASGNVSSITDNGTGDYTVNFATALPDANYAPSFSTTALNDAFSTRHIVINGSSSAPTTKTTTALRIRRGDTASSGNEDGAEINVFILR